LLTLLLGTDWVANSRHILQRICEDVSQKKAGRILMVPELISHSAERQLCEAAGDTACRYAEVLSFTRLASRVSDTVGHGATECLDNGGRVVAMASAARQLHSRLKAYAAVETRPEFLTGLIDAVDEFKRCCITPADLMTASRQTEGSLAQKLEELSLLLECYDSLCHQGKRDPRDQMTWLLEELEDSSYAREHTFYIDGFPDFTRQHMAILEHLIAHCANVTVSLNCDVPGSKQMAFEKAGQTALDLIHCAKRLGVAVSIENTTPNTNSLSLVREKLFQGKIDKCIPGDVLRLYRTESVYQECVAAAERILDLVHHGARYRDISVVCADSASYTDTLEMVFSRCKIPAYLSGTEDILEKTVLSAVLTAMDTALGGFEQQDVLRYMKSVLSPLKLSVCDEIENYAKLWNVNGNRWLTEWTQHPGGLGWNQTEESIQTLQRLNNARKQVIEPLERLNKGFLNAENLAQQVKVLYSFFEQINLADRLASLATELDECGDHRNAQMLNQLWDILTGALEQLYDVLGNTAWDTETFTRLFKLLLSQYDVGSIPPVLDSVTVGPVSAMRCQQTKHLIVLGALEGSLPGYGGSTGVLTDQERVALRQMGVPLTGGAMEGLQAEFSEIYGVFCGASESVTVSCPSGQPSVFYRRLVDLAGVESTPSYGLGAALCDELEAGAYLARMDLSQQADDMGLRDAYNQAIKKRDHSLGNISQENIRLLYRDKLKLSASQVDKQAQCRLSYFLQYGLRAKECKEATVDPAEFGTYVHAVLEETAKEVKELGGFRNVSLEDTLAIADRHSENYARARFDQLDTSRIDYLFRRNSQELALIVRELWDELHDSKFEPAAFEVAFGTPDGLSAIETPGRAMDAQLRGVVDRVDTWLDGDNTYFRVVDYKTGKKSFDYCDVFNGLGLQMLLYLFALEQEGCDLLGDSPVPAGVQYFPARVPLVSADGLLSDEEAFAARQKLWKRSGLLLAQEDVLLAMESDEKSGRMPYSKKKDGSISGDIADKRQMQLLKAYVFGLLGKMVDEIASGCVTPNPYTRGSSHNACTYCPYSSVCHLETVTERRNYKTMSSQKFWEEVEKEVVDRG